MDILAPTLIQGVSSGALDALLALGVVLIYRTTGVLNFAQAATGTLAGYTIFSVSQGRPLWIAILGGVLVGAVAGVATNAAVGGIRSRQYSLTSAVATLAVAILMQQIVRIGWGSTQAQFPNPFGFSAITVGTVNIAYLSLAGVIVAALLALVIASILHFTRVGTMIRALSDNPGAARLSGGNVPLLIAGVWATAGALAAVAGFFAAQIVFDPSYMDPFFVAALVAAVLGGLRSLTGAFLGAIGLEVSRNLFQAYVSSWSAYTETFLLILLIVILVFAPPRWLARAPERSV